MSNPDTLPRTGRVPATNKVAAVLRGALFADAGPRIEAEIAPIRERMILAYSLAAPPEELEVLKRWFLVDYVEQAAVHLHQEKHDDFVKLLVPLNAKITIPQSYQIGFYCGGVPQEVLDRNAARRDPRSRIISLDEFLPNARAINAIQREITQTVTDCRVFVEGVHDGNVRTRPLWSEVYAKFPALTRFREEKA